MFVLVFFFAFSAILPLIFDLRLRASHEDFILPRPLIRSMKLVLIGARPSRDYPLNIDFIDAARASLTFVINAAVYCMSRILDATLRVHSTDAV